MNHVPTIAELKDTIARRRERILQERNGHSRRTKTDWQGENAPLEDLAVEEMLLQEIMRIYSLADTIVRIIAASDAGNQQILLPIARPYVDAATCLADTISSFCVAAAENNWRVAPEWRTEIEAEFRHFFDTLRKAIDAMEEKLVPHDHENQSADDLPSFRPASPLSEKFLARLAKRGTDGNRIVRIRAKTKDHHGKFFAFSIEDLGCHIAQILIEFDQLGIANYKKGYPFKGFTDNLLKKHRI